MPGLTARDYLFLPWSIHGPTKVVDEHGNTHFEMRVAELPDFFVAGTNESEVLYEFNGALLAFLESYTSEGETPPVPSGKPVKYLPPALAPRPPVNYLRVEKPPPVTAGAEPSGVALVLTEAAA